jgi:transcriptional regulator with XRE-family HTH domain
MDWKKELGIQLRESRGDLNLQQSEISECVKLHVNMISRHETGAAAPELDNLIRLAIALEKDEFRIGDYVVSIKPVDGAVQTLSQSRQLRLKYGEEYVFDSHGTSMKIQPSREGLFIIPAERKIGII